MVIFSKKYGFVCFGMTRPDRKPYFYVSPNAEPWASTYYLGPDKEEQVRSKVRKEVFGHNFEVHGYNEEYRAHNYDILQTIRELVSPDFGHYVYYRKKLLDHSSN